MLRESNERSKRNTHGSISSSEWKTICTSVLKTLENPEKTRLKEKFYLKEKNWKEKLFI